MSVFRTVLRRPVGVVCLGWLALVVLACLVADLVAPYDPRAQDLASVYSGPTGAHWLGTDQLGRDVLSRVLHGGRVSLLVVGEALLVYVVLGCLLGVLAGYRGGLLDRVVLRTSDLLLSMPTVVILLVVLAIFPHDESAAMITLGALSSAGLARVVRASTRHVREEPYVAAARVAGLTTPRVLARHVLPAVAGPVISLVSLIAGSALLVEASLGFLGLGVQPPEPSWGGLIAEASQAIYRQPWMLVPTGGVVALTAIACALLGDVLRDASDDRAGSETLSWRRMRTPVGPAEPPTSAPDDTAVLSVRDLSVRLEDGTALVEGVGFDLHRGGAVGLVGESGCGKTMAISAVLRLLPPGAVVTASALRYRGADLLGLDERGMGAVRGSGIAYIAQDPVASLDPLFTVGDQLREAVRAHHRATKAEVDRRVLELVEDVHLPADVLGRYPHQLSGGMAQRVSIARALAGDPAVLVADEPTTALDVTVQAEVLDLLRELRERTGMALLIVTHDWGVVADTCDTAVVMYAGQVVERTAVDRVFSAPRHPYTRALLAADPGAAEPGTRLPVVPGVVPPPGRRPIGCRFAPRCAFATAECKAGPVRMTTEPLGAAGYRCLHPRQPIGARA
ncbi:dipeptide/oligopeptide/nickel ABC transporter permease/ATP-binding protein [Actinosynnema sp. NPDC020468]|uniref:dipeptide/oligopeptide/nickel ABC transporter permease/ATP-binding protein n=1 Tax=Actinosynnema sp. NPDC020468 TaxID=3154488 RepID=UPI003401B8E4